MKLTKDGVDVCEVGFILRGDLHTEEYKGFLGQLAGKQLTEQTYTVECKTPVKFTGGNYQLVEGELSAPIRPFGYNTEEGKDAFDKPTYTMRFTALWPKEWQ